MKKRKGMYDDMTALSLGLKASLSVLGGEELGQRFRFDGATTATILLDKAFGECRKDLRTYVWNP